MIFHCTTVFVLLPTNPTLDSSACMSVHPCQSIFQQHAILSQRGSRKVSKPYLNQNLFP